MYSHRSGADNPREQNFDVNRNLLSLRSFATSLKKTLYFYTIFFMILYMYIAPGQGLTTPWGQNFDVNRNLLSLQSYAASFKRSPWSLILYNKCSLAGADSPQGTKFWCQQICLVTSFICCKFKKNLFEVWFYTFFFSWFNTGDYILVSTERPYHFSHLLQVSKKSLWSLILYNCFHD